MTITRLNFSGSEPPVLVTGGCGFVGSNIAAELAAGGRPVIVLDNLSRWGARENAAWLIGRFANLIAIEVADVRDAELVRALVAGAGAVMHLAGQVAVTTSLQDPVEDFDVNARGTLNVLEAVRLCNPHAPVLFASTNKVYGRLLADDHVHRVGDRHLPRNGFDAGVAEDVAIDLYSPYGCSKGAADQYVRDYARVFGLRTVVLRMSCIYGPRQLGNEDQGWIAHFLLQSIQNRTITIYGDGCQVRDALYVSDAVSAWIAALDRIDAVSGRVFNLGGGPENSVSLLEMIDLIAALRRRRPRIEFAEARAGDQPWYVSDIRRVAASLDWSPRTPLRNGLQALNRWLDDRFSHADESAELLEAQA